MFLWLIKQFYLAKFQCKQMMKKNSRHAEKEIVFIWCDYKKEMLKHQDFFLEAEPMTSDSVSLCGGRQFSRKFSKKEYPLLGDSDHGNAQCSKICKKNS